jgi:hypothetical protein
MSVSPESISKELQTKELLAQATQVLHDNDHGHYTAPAKGLYSHQWLWDSCFTAIGLRHLDTERAKTEIMSMLRGQWSNGMVPHMIFIDDNKKARDWGIWHSWLSPNAPDDISTSGITQPPMLAEAAVRIGEKLPLPERRSWYKQVYPHLVAYHEWLYADRDPHNEGLVLLIHPWESGLDNTPPWMSELHHHLLPWWIRALKAIKLEPIFGLLRTDTRFVAREQRLTNTESLALYSIQKRLRRKNYDISAILNHSIFTIEDLSFNSILVRANSQLESIARTIRRPLPDALAEHIKRTSTALEDLWDPYTAQYYSRDFVTHHLLKEPSIATLLPLYAGNISKDRAASLVRLLESDHLFGPAYPVPSVPLESSYFDPQRYWQGPTWVNMNWLIIDGLRRYGFDDHADALTESTLEMIAKHGIAEYYNPLTGEPLGAHNFSWTAALAIDMLKS